MRLLLDTHVALWLVASPRNLPAAIRDLITDSGSNAWVSVISLAEIAIKYPLARGGVGAMPIGAPNALKRFEEAGFDLLDLSPRHTIALEDLPLIHRDPFDRLLVAQAMDERMRLVTHDSIVASYSDTIIHF